jgi:hypothetical protein
VQYLIETDPIRAAVAWRDERNEARARIEYARHFGAQLNRWQCQHTAVRAVPRRECTSCCEAEGEYWPEPRLMMHLEASMAHSVQENAIKRNALNTNCDLQNLRDLQIKID